jgi:hypothetical protein
MRPLRHPVQYHRNTLTRSCIGLAYQTGVQTLPPARLFSSWVLQDHRYDMVDVGVWRQVKDEGRESPVRFLEYTFLPEGVAEALRSHSRRSQRVLGVYSPFILKLVSCLFYLHLFELRLWVQSLF